MNVSKLTQNEKVKKYVNKKVLLGASSLFVCILLIVVCSFVPFIIDPSRWQTTEFLTDELIICAITIFAMVATMFIGQSSNAQDEKSNLAKARVKFMNTVGQITNLNAFNQWVKKILQPQDIKSVKERHLRSVGVEDITVLELEYSEIDSLLETPQKINDRYYKGLSKEQIKEIKDIKNGKIKIDLVEPSYYTSVSKLIDKRTISERSSKEGLKKGLYLTRSIVSKLLLTVITGMILASLMRDISREPDVAESIQKFISRLWALCSSCFMGFLVGTQINDIDAEYLEMRISVQNMYLQDKTFVPLDQQEEAKHDYIEKVKKDNEEYAKSLQLKDREELKTNLPVMKG